MKAVKGPIAKQHSPEKKTINDDLHAGEEVGHGRSSKEKGGVTVNEGERKPWEQRRVS